MSPRLLAYLVALLGFLSDQALKLFMLYGFDIAGVMERRGPVRLAPFFDLVLVWNRGISYGWFQQHDAAGRWILIGIAIAASVFIGVWIWRISSPMLGIGLGLVLGGALGNGLDRLLHGAVVDLFHFHYGSFSWYVFNLADVWIVVGAALLVYDSFFGSGRASGPSSPNDAANS